MNGPGDPNFIVPTAPLGTKDYRAASTAFVAAATSAIAFSVFDFMTAAQIAAVLANTPGVDVTAALQAAEAARPVGAKLVWPAGTYTMTAPLSILNPGEHEWQGTTLNSTAGNILIKSSNFLLNGGESTFNYTGAAGPNLNRALRVGGNGLVQPLTELTTGGNIAVGATSFVAGLAGDAAGLAANDWVMVALVNQADDNWLQVEFKQVVSVTGGGTTVNVAPQFAQAFTAAGGPTGHLVHWIKILSPIQNVAVRDLTIIGGAGAGIAIDGQPGVIDFTVEGCTTDMPVGGLGIQAFAQVNPQIIRNVIRQKQSSRHSAISSCQGGRFSGNRFWNYGGAATVHGLTIETGTFGLRHDHNEYYGGTGGAGVISANNVNHCIFASDLVIGDGSNNGLVLSGSSNNTVNGSRFINLSFGIVPITDGSSPVVGANENLLIGNAFRNCSGGAIQVHDSGCTGNTILGIDWDSTVTNPPLSDLGTGTNAFYTRQGGGFAALGGFSIIGADAAAIALIAGGTHAVRFGADGAAAYVEFVDQTGAGSYQPGIINGSTLDLRASAASKLTITSALATFLTQLAIATATPASAAAAGTTGQIAWDSGFIYICTATNTWKRVAIATW